jgi:hypothetical protein
LTGRAIRPSQFVLTYGVGSIIETDSGARIIPTFDRWGKYFNMKYSENEIPDASALIQLGKHHSQPKIFRIPTNSDLRVKDSQPIFSLVVFPRWSVCMEHSGDPLLLKMDDRGRLSCPECREQNRTRETGTAVRFVTACPKGHMSDVDWPALVHSGGDFCKNTIFKWTGEGQAARNIEILCTVCRSTLRLSDIFRLARENKLACAGMFPEQSYKSKSCGEKAKLVLRNASNLRIPQILTSLTIPYRDSPLYNILSDSTFYAIVSDRDIWDKGELLSELRKRMKRNPEINQIRLAEIEKYSNDEINETINQLILDKTTVSKDEESVKIDEFRALVAASKHGAPPSHSTRQTRFEVERNKVIKIKKDDTRWGLEFVVTPVKTLHVTLVQLGYQREVGGVESQLVKTSYEDRQGRSWFPGIDMTGEGIFIYLDSTSTPRTNSEWDSWMRRYEASNGDGHDHPLFVWWHSLAHRIITGLSIDSGYSSASIRERVYLDLNRSNPSEARGGVLFYSAQTGGDGTMGGLISLAPRFYLILERALKDIGRCSNDPLCEDRTISPGKKNGAACYTCLLLSETSCDHLNRSLDRNVLRMEDASL